MGEPLLLFLGEIKTIIRNIQSFLFSAELLNVYPSTVNNK